MPSILQDAQFALKLLLKEKSFTAAAVLTLALCIGANAAIFSLLNSVILRPLPFEAGDRLVHIYNSYPRAGVERGGASVPDYYDRREHVPAMQHVALVSNRGVTIGEAGRPQRVVAETVTPSLFPMLGIQPVLGRTFLEAEAEPGNHRHAVLSWGLWHDEFGADPAVVGRTIRIDDESFAVVGVMPRGFVFREREARLWLPLAFSETQRSDDARHSNNWEMVGKLHPGATAEQAQQQIDALNAALAERLPQFRDLLAQVGFTTIVRDYRSDLTRDVRGTLWLLQAGVLVVLLIGCVNIANLVLVRATARNRELATRAAIGAGHGRLASQLLTESVVLALLGGVAGVALALGAVRAFSAFIAPELPPGTTVALDATPMLAALLTAVLAGLLFGAIPVMHLLRTDLGSVFRDEGRSSTASRSTRALRGGLVVTQVALAFALLVGAGLMLVSFSRTLDVATGFDPANLTIAAVSLPVTRYTDDAARRTLAAQLTERLRAIPGVEHAALATPVPFGGAMNAGAVTPEGYEPRADDALVAPVISHVSTDYFETMGIEPVVGRTFNDGDREGALPVAVVDRFLADRFWPGQDPIGKRVARGVAVTGEELDYRTVVGVVENVRMHSLTGDEPLGHFYVPLDQQPAAALFIAIRGAQPPAELGTALSAAVAELDPGMPVYDLRTMPERLAGSVVSDRLRTILLLAFGVLALFLAAVGLYGVLAYTVAQRVPEIGIRLALGSSTGAIFRMVLRHGAVLIGTGLVIGVAASLTLGRVMRTMLFDVEPGDPWVIAVVLLVLGVTAMAACMVPARRAMRVDPMAAMRDA